MSEYRYPTGSLYPRDIKVAKSPATTGAAVFKKSYVSDNCTT